mmetsp:Transcript_58917/g.140625  ORF Transcript_58917/g.140625 Transcript_58917/m.140625 type:complete len:570 (+) Transcript_58917:139-1848(+)|eukprot:CAMPEP_0178410838 /NCGR_PEP_ID=MMETSP0689_2-20121128/21190_1 /TAXON_ID=160604 /ORGANISM="Amphidinium massartii, Strain CS-259" /LENGTH=569 /DNA_ID=CAMNT_0020032035 /DNA_START=49 /DNA_END=1758 /DNA_ORIENTATION=+
MSDGEKHVQLLKTIQEVRHVTSIDADPNLLQQIAEFLQSHLAESPQEASHLVLESYPDWWCRCFKAVAGLTISSSEDEQLYQHVATLYRAGIPLTLAERRTPLFRFFLEIEAWGTAKESISQDELIGIENPLTTLLGKIVGEAFPGREFLDVAVLDSSGMSQTKGMQKLSIRLVWPGLVVDAERAVRLRDFIVNRLVMQTDEGGALANLEAKLKEHNPKNSWFSVFSDAAFLNRYTVRMPLNDRVSPAPLRAPENRPFKPVGVLRFAYSDDKKMAVEWICQPADLDLSEWVKIGCVRAAASGELSEWAVPPTTSSLGQPNTAKAFRGGRVKIRSSGGSDAVVVTRVCPNRIAPPLERAGAHISVDRQVTSMEKLVAIMDQHLSKAVVENDGAMVWHHNGGEAKVVVNIAEKSVKVMGRSKQVCNLVVMLNPVTDAVATFGKLPRHTTSRVAPVALPSIPRANGTEAPEAQAAVASTTSEIVATSADTGSIATATAHVGSQGEHRLVCQTFDSVGDGELALDQGDKVVIVHDPEACNASTSDRWVYGKNEANGACGWFPLSHTMEVEHLN